MKRAQISIMNQVLVGQNVTIHNLNQVALPEGIIVIRDQRYRKKAMVIAA